MLVALQVQLVKDPDFAKQVSIADLVHRMLIEVRADQQAADDQTAGDALPIVVESPATIRTSGEGGQTEDPRKATGPLNGAIGPTAPTLSTLGKSPEVTSPPNRAATTTSTSSSTRIWCGRVPIDEFSQHVILQLVQQIETDAPSINTVSNLLNKPGSRGRTLMYECLDSSLFGTVKLLLKFGASPKVNGTVKTDDSCWEMLRERYAESIERPGIKTVGKDNHLNIIELLELSNWFDLWMMMSEGPVEEFEVTEVWFGQETKKRFTIGALLSQEPQWLTLSDVSEKGKRFHIHVPANNVSTFPSTHRSQALMCSAIIGLRIACKIPDTCPYKADSI